jgi:hypothetical protein
VIEEREFERLGGRRTIKLNARLIALTNVDLESASPLRERKEDLSKLIQYFVKHYATKHGRKSRARSAAGVETAAGVRVHRADAGCDPRKQNRVRAHTRHQPQEPLREDCAVRARNTDSVKTLILSDWLS